MGTWSCGDQNDNGSRMVQFCCLQDLLVASTLVNRPAKKKWTFEGNFGASRTSRKRREYDNFMCSSNLRTRIDDVFNIRNTLHDSDHCLRVARFKLTANMVSPRKKIKAKTNALRLKSVAALVDIALHNRFGPLLQDDKDLPDDVKAQDVWTDFKEQTHRTAEEVKHKPVASKPWISDQTFELVQERARMRQLQSHRGETSLKLKEIRKKVKRAARRDKRRFYSQLADQAEKASVLGKQREIYKIISRIKGVRAGAADLTGVDLDRWLAHFQTLLGKPGTPPPAFIKKKIAWKKAASWLADKSKYATPWAVNTGPPTLKELRAAINSCKNNKGVNRDQLPSELRKHSSNATLLLWKLVRRVWVQIKVSDGKTMDIPPDWLDATLVCLFKNKGSRQDPSKYRGISLISSVEKLLSIIILKRIQGDVDKRLLQGQNGFRPLKSCRDAVFQLWRAIEKSNQNNDPFIFTFIDYSKAFDSLDWDKLWPILEFAGCPIDLIRVMKTMYAKSTISIRLSSDGTLAPSFEQKRGIRQGSSLSPCLFVLAMDYCLRVFEATCTEAGLPSHESAWFAYADDLADKAMTEQEASEALQQLEAASAFVGLRLNVSKTEVMAKRITKTVIVTSSKATAELVEVQYDDGAFRGWKTKVEHAHHLKITETPDKKTSDIVIQFEDGDIIFAKESGGGWLRDEDGDAHRIRKLGFIQTLEGKSHVCTRCASSFDTERGLQTHQGGRWCRMYMDMSTAELRRLHRTRRSSLTFRGKPTTKLETVSVTTCEGKTAKPCGSFVYLGTLTSPDVSATPEVRRRIGMGLSSFGNLNKLWKDKSISSRTKARLYKALGPINHAIQLRNLDYQGTRSYSAGRSSLSDDAKYDEFARTDKCFSYESATSFSSSRHR